MSEIQHTVKASELSDSGSIRVVEPVAEGEGFGLKASCPIEPIEFCIVVKPDTVSEQTAGGLHKPPELVEKEQHAMTKGVLVAVSDLAFTDGDGGQWGRVPRIGERVMFVRYAGTLDDEIEGGPFRVMKDKDVLGVLG